MVQSTERNPTIRALATALDNGSMVIRNKNLMMFDVLRAHAQRSGQPSLKGIRFENCQIEGPAVLLPISGCHFDDCNFNATDDDMRSVLLAPVSPTKVTGAIAMVECTFIAVDFFGIGFTGVQTFLDTMMGVQNLGQVR